MEEDIDIIGNNEGDTNTDTITGGSHFSNLQLSFTNHEKDGSLHALQTAYSEVKKRLQEQVNKNAILQTSIREIEMQRISGGRPNSGVFGAAGPPSEPEQDLQAQYRAEFGFAQSLERQVIRAKSTISKLESDNKLLMKKLTQQEEELKQCKAREFETRKENERLRVQLNNNQGQTQEHSELLAEIQKKDGEIQNLQEEIRNLRELLKGQGTEIPSLNSITQEEEVRIIDQVERYSATIKNLKEQVKAQGQMLGKQKDAIKKLIESAKSTSLSSSTSRYAAEGASFYPTHYETEQAQKATEYPNPTMDLYAERKPLLVSNFPTLQTMPPADTSQTLNEQFHQLNFTKPDPDKRLFRGPTESEYNVPGTGYPNMCTPSVLTESKNSRTTVVGGLSRGGNIEETYPLAGKGVNISMKKPASTQDFSMYENLDMLTEMGNGERVQTSEDQTMQYTPSPGNHLFNLEDSDYVNLKDVNPGRGASNFPVISPNVKVVPSSDDKKKLHRQPQEHGTMGGNSPPQSVIRPLSTQVKGEERDRRNKVNVQSSLGRVPQENPQEIPLKPEIRTVPGSSATRPKQVVQKTPSGNSQICPVCGQDFVNISMENFQMHVFHCMDNDGSEDCTTLHNVSPTNQKSSKDVRICPMCDASYPSEMQSEFETHVQEHFGEEPIIDKFEILRH